MHYGCDASAGQCFGFCHEGHTKYSPSLCEDEWFWTSFDGNKNHTSSFCKTNEDCRNNKAWYDRTGTCGHSHVKQTDPKIISNLPRCYKSGWSISTTTTITSTTTTMTTTSTTTITTTTTTMTTTSTTTTTASQCSVPTTTTTTTTAATTNSLCSAGFAWDGSSQSSKSRFQSCTIIVHDFCALFSCTIARFFLNRTRFSCHDYRATFIIS